LAGLFVFFAQPSSPGCVAAMNDTAKFNRKNAEPAGPFPLVARCNGPLQTPL